jgi:xanthine dehydrogenase large subunit
VTPAGVTLARSGAKVFWFFFSKKNFFLTAGKTMIHQPIAHESATRHVCGTAIYIDDSPLPEHLLHAWVITSTRAHAKLIDINLDKVRAAAGIICALTASDIPGQNDAGPILTGEPLLAQSTVTYAGEPIAVIAATSLAAARAAADLAQITYEDLPATLTIEAALGSESYVVPPMLMQRGTPDDAMAAAPHRLHGTCQAGGQDHFYLETQIAQAEPREGADIHVFSSTQHPTEVQHIVARVLGLPLAAVTVEVRRMGGGFGGKESHASLIAAMAALCAHHTKKPVRLRLVRDADMVITGKRHDVQASFSVGYDDDGRILAMDMLIALRAGNVADLSGPVLTRALCHADNAYWLPNIRVRGFAAKTNTVSNTAFRGFGGPQGVFAIESVILHLAAALGKSPDDIRAINYYAPGRDITPYGQHIGADNLPRVLADLAMQARPAERQKSIAAFNQKSTIIKKGLATVPVKFGISFNLPSLNQAGALVHVYTDGSVHLNHGGTEMGQGLYLKIAQVAAAGFALPLSDIHISSTRTDKVPNTSATAASSGTDINGMAALAAITTIKARMAEVAAAELEGTVDDVIFQEGRVFVGNRSLAFGELAQKCWAARVSLSATGFYKTPEIHFDQASMTGNPFYYFTHGACTAEAAINTLTGEARILAAHIVQDCGTSLNQAVDIGQIEGAFIQGLGWLLMEELYWDPSGTLKTHAPSTYKIPTARDVPPVFVTKLLENAPNAKPTIFRSKAVGEPPFMLAIACFQAIQAAIAAHAGWPAALPLAAPATPEAILKALSS